jgi:hypothetical protein
MPGRDAGARTPQQLRCDEAGECLREHIRPSRDSSAESLYQNFYDALDECFGRDRNEFSLLQPCTFPKVTDPFNGFELQPYVMCDDACPMAAVAGIKYANVSDTECLCFGGWKAAHRPCAPIASGSDCSRRRISLRTEMRDGRAVSVIPVVPPFPKYYWLRPGDVIQSINEQPAGDPAAVDRLFHRWPEKAPDSIRVRRGTVSLEIRYVSPQLLREAERLMDQARVFNGQTERQAWADVYRHPDWPRLVAENRVRAWDPSRRTAETARFEATASEVADLGRASRHTRSRPAGNFDCRSVRDMLLHVTVEMPGGNSLELAYIDWIGAGVPPFLDRSRECD